MDDTTKMVERVARALATNEGLAPDGLCHGISPDGARNWEIYVSNARAAIEAMAEPTEDMQNIGNNRYNEMVRNSPIKDHSAYRPHIYEAWQAMIDAALGGDKKCE